VLFRGWCSLLKKAIRKKPKMGGGIFPVPHPTKDLPQECDILIIGAGLADVGIAYYLLDENSNPPDIVMLEAREVCSGGTGRNSTPSPLTI
jgi:hypothetical protein